MSTLTRRLAVIYSLTLTQARCLSILTPSGSLPVYSHSIRLAACLFSHYQANCLSMYSLALTQACCLSILTLTQARCLSILTLTQARCLSILRLAACLFSLSPRLAASILTLSGSLSIYSHTQVTVYLFSHPMLLKHSCSLAHQCIRAHSRAHCLSILILATYLVPHPGI